MAIARADAADRFPDRPRLAVLTFGINPITFGIKALTVEIKASASEKLMVITEMRRASSDEQGAQFEQLNICFGVKSSSTIQNIEALFCY
jgi:hypothetical protein